jgi:cytochrome c peroxidase
MSRVARHRTALYAVVVTCATAAPLTAQDAAAYRAPVPLGLETYMPVPDDNPLTAVVVALGRRLFFDPALSADGRISCASCHRPELAFADSARFSRGVYGRLTRRNTPSVLNAGWQRSWRWDGRTTSLEQQVLEPIEDEREMARPLDELVRVLATDVSYERAFAAAFGTRDPVSAANLGRALASYVRALRSGDAPADRFAAGETGALTPVQRAGFRLFVGRANCASCHGGPLFTDHRFHDTGTARGALADVGREAVTGAAEDRHRFRTPSLRNIALTAPYMHDGSLATLADVIEFYDAGGRAGPNLDREIRPLGLTPEEKAALRAYLEALTGRFCADQSGSTGGAARATNRLQREFPSAPLRRNPPRPRLTDLCRATRRPVSR